MHSYFWALQVLQGDLALPTEPQLPKAQILNATKPPNLRLDSHLKLTV